MTKRAHWLGLAAAVALTGCQAPTALHQLRQPLLVLGMEAPAMTGATRTTARPLALGELTINFSGELAKLRKRSVLAAVSDVDRVVVTVKPAGAAEVSQTVLKAAIANGQTTVTFPGLPAGDATVIITAFDAAGLNIGSAVKSATVLAGQVAAVDVSVQLAPTYVGAGGGSSPTTGGLTTNVTLQDGVALPGAKKASGEIIGTYPIAVYPIALAADKGGNVWVGGSGTPGSSDGKLIKVGPDGTVLASIQFGSSIVSLAMEASGAVWAIDSGGAESAKLWKFDPTGQKLAEWGDLEGATKQLALAGDGSVFFTVPTMSEFYRLDPTTGAVTRLTIGPNLGTAPGGVAADPNGDILLLTSDGSGSKLLRFAPNGTRLAESALSFSPDNLAVDGQRHIWAMNSGSGTLQELLPDGSVARALSGFTDDPGPYMYNQRMGFDAGNQGWVLSATALKRLAPDGTIAGTYTLPTGSGRVSVGPAGVWSSTQSGNGQNYVTLSAK